MPFTLDSVPAKRARKYLLEQGFYPERGVLPLTFTAELSKLSPKKWSWKNKKFPIDYSPITFRERKSDSSWTKYTIIHPWIYWQLVDLLTEPKNWKLIQKFLSKKRAIICHSIPTFKGERKEIMHNWKLINQVEVPMNSENYSILIRLDIKGFYPSIYTHSIAWPLHGKEKSKQDHFDRKLFGSKVDKLFQNSNSGQTKGIPIGPMVSDIFSEIILAAVDETIDKSLRKMDVKYRAFRFKDDYWFLCRSQDDYDEIIQAVMNALDEYSLELNQNKTKVFSPVLLGVHEKDYQEEELLTLSIDPESRSYFEDVRKALSRLLKIQLEDTKNDTIGHFFNRRIDKGKLYDQLARYDDVRLLLAYVLPFASLNKQTFTSVIQIVNEIFEKCVFITKPKKRKILNNMLESAIRSKSIHESIWVVYSMLYNDIALSNSQISLIKRVFKKDKAFRLIEVMMQRTFGSKGIVFESFPGNFDGMIEQQKLINKDIKEQKKNRVIYKIRYIESSIY